MKLANHQALFNRNQGDQGLGVTIHRDDPIVAHAIQECCTYICDVMHRMGVRSFNAVLAQKIASQMMEELSDGERWERYLRETAPKMEQEFLTLLRMNDTGS
jgi:hypothetical protein